MRTWLFALLVGCSSPAAAPDAADAGPGEDVTPTTEGPFDLDLTVHETLPSGEDASTLMFVAVRDAETKELIAFVGDDEKLVSTVAVKKSGVLLAGHRYEVGVKDTWFASCHDAGSNVWYREIPAVAGHVTLTVDVRPSVALDERGCDVLHEPVGLPPGTYATTSAVLGIPGNEVRLLVSATGRVYTESLRIFCGTTSSCVSTTIGFGDCELEEAIYPGTTTFSLGSSAASKTTVKGTATIDVAAGTIRYTGRTYTWTGTSTICCDKTFDVTLKRVGPESAMCK
jgi:hypothetical protein